MMISSMPTLFTCMKRKERVVKREKNVQDRIAGASNLLKRSAGVSEKAW